MLSTILDLGKIPLVNNLKNTKTDAINVKKYNLRATIDENLTVKLDTDVDPSELFGDYVYRSGVSKPFINHCKKMWYDVQHYIFGAIPFTKPNYTPLIVDIGGNDGTLLKSFKSQHDENKLGKIDYINVDPSNFSEDNEKDGIKYIQDYWGEHVELPRKANLIVSTNVFQHNPNPENFIAGIKKHLHGVWVLEFPYFLNTAKTNQFDQFYHEHYYYWLVTPLVKLFEKHDLFIFDISYQDIHGGSLRLFISNIRESDPSIIKKYTSQEEKFNFSGWKTQIQNKIFTDNDFISKILNNGKIACFGAAAKGCVYLNSIFTDYVQHKMLYVVDDTPDKQGKFIPGVGLEIVNREILYATQPEYLIILAHNFKSYIIDSLRPKYKGKIVVMLPEIEIYD